MIGGEDIVLPGKTMGHEADLVLRQFRVKWPAARVQKADEVDALPFTEFSFPVVTRETEFFIYRDSENCLSWKTSGATEENQSAMVHVIVTDDSVTIVTDHIDSELSDFSRETLKSIARNRILLGRTLPAAA